MPKKKRKVSRNIQQYLDGNKDIENLLKGESISIRSKLNISNAGLSRSLTDEDLVLIIKDVLEKVVSNKSFTDDSALNSAIRPTKGWGDLARDMQNALAAKVQELNNISITQLNNLINQAAAEQAKIFKGATVDNVKLLKKEVLLTTLMDPPQPITKNSIDALTRETAIDQFVTPQMDKVKLDGVPREQVTQKLTDAMKALLNNSNYANSDDLKQIIRSKSVVATPRSAATPRSVLSPRSEKDRVAQIRQQFATMEKEFRDQWPQIKTAVDTSRREITIIGNPLESTTLQVAEKKLARLKEIKAEIGDSKGLNERGTIDPKSSKWEDYQNLASANKTLSPNDRQNFRVERGIESDKLNSAINNALIEVRNQIAKWETAAAKLTEAKKAEAGNAQATRAQDNEPVRAAGISNLLAGALNRKRQPGSDDKNTAVPPITGTVTQIPPAPQRPAPPPPVPPLNFNKVNVQPKPQNVVPPDLNRVKVTTQSDVVKPEADSFNERARQEAAKKAAVKDFTDKITVLDNRLAEIDQRPTLDDKERDITAIAKERDTILAALQIANKTDSSFGALITSLSKSSDVLAVKQAEISYLRNAQGLFDQLTAIDGKVQNIDVTDPNAQAALAAVAQQFRQIQNGSANFVNGQTASNKTKISDRIAASDAGLNAAVAAAKAAAEAALKAAADAAAKAAADAAAKEAAAAAAAKEQAKSATRALLGDLRNDITIAQQALASQTSKADVSIEALTTATNNAERAQTALTGRLNALPANTQEFFSDELTGARNELGTFGEAINAANEQLKQLQAKVAADAAAAAAAQAAADAAAKKAVEENEQTKTLLGDLRKDIATAQQALASQTSKADVSVEALTTAINNAGGAQTALTGRLNALPANAQKSFPGELTSARNELGTFGEAINAANEQLKQLQAKVAADAAAAAAAQAAADAAAKKAAEENEQTKALLGDLRKDIATAKEELATSTVTPITDALTDAIERAEQAETALTQRLTDLPGNAPEFFADDVASANTEMGEFRTAIETAKTQLEQLFQQAEAAAKLAAELAATKTHAELLEVFKQKLAQLNTDIDAQHTSLETKPAATAAAQVKEVFDQLAAARPASAAFAARYDSLYTEATDKKVQDELAKEFNDSSTKLQSLDTLINTKVAASSQSVVNLLRTPLIEFPWIQIASLAKIDEAAVTKIQDNIQAAKNLQANLQPIYTSIKPTMNALKMGELVLTTDAAFANFTNAIRTQEATLAAHLKTANYADLTAQIDRLNRSVNNLLGNLADPISAEDDLDVIKQNHINLLTLLKNSHSELDTKVRKIQTDTPGDLQTELNTLNTIKTNLDKAQTLINNLAITVKIDNLITEINDHRAKIKNEDVNHTNNITVQIATLETEQARLASVYAQLETEFNTLKATERPDAMSPILGQLQIAKALLDGAQLQLDTLKAKIPAAAATSKLSDQILRKLAVDHHQKRDVSKLTTAQFLQTIKDLTKEKDSRGIDIDYINLKIKEAKGPNAKNIAVREKLVEDWNKNIFPYVEQIKNRLDMLDSLREKLETEAKATTPSVLYPKRADLDTALMKVGAAYSKYQDTLIALYDPNRGLRSQIAQHIDALEFHSVHISSNIVPTDMVQLITRAAGQSDADFQAEIDTGVQNLGGKPASTPVAVGITAKEASFNLTTQVAIMRINGSSPQEITANSPQTQTIYTVSAGANNTQPDVSTRSIRMDMDASNVFMSYVYNNPDFLAKIKPDPSKSDEQRVRAFFASYNETTPTADGLKTFLQEKANNGEITFGKNNSLFGMFSSTHPEAASLGTALNNAFISSIRDANNLKVPNEKSLTIGLQMIRDFVNVTRGNEQLVLYGNNPELLRTAKMICEVMKNSLTDPGAQWKYNWIDNKDMTNEHFSAKDLADTKKLLQKIDPDFDNKIKLENIREHPIEKEKHLQNFATNMQANDSTVLAQATVIPTVPRRP